MNTLRTDLRNQRRGFTLVEILVVIGIIVLLMSISFAAINSALGTSRQRATQATLLKLHGLVQQRVDAFNRAMDRTNLVPATNKLNIDMKNQIGIAPSSISATAATILAKKQIFQFRFPQNFAENPILKSSPGYLATAHNPNTESAALLYWILTKSEIYGVAPVDESEFGASEVRDTDGDGLLEFVDNWGHPLRYYRWPTHLFRSGYYLSPGNAPSAATTTSPGVNGSNPVSLTLVDPSRTFANVLWSGLPAPAPQGSLTPSARDSLDPLSRDPDDPTGELWRFVNNSSSPAVVLTTLQNRFHTPNTYHAFLIVSAGPDNNLGIGEPYDYSTNPTSPGPDTTTFSSSSPALASTPGQGRLTSVLSFGTTNDPISTNAINDNLTNRRR